MLIRLPDYYDAFHCLAGACPHSCCEKWEVVIDDDSAAFYQKTPGSLGKKLRAALRQDEDGDLCFPLNGGRCPFLDDENLCEIHRQLGEEATSITCREHPRFTEDYGPFLEITLSASCPAANALLLGSEAPLAFFERITEEPEEDGDTWLQYLLPLRGKLLELLQDRSLPLRLRLQNFLLLAAEAQYRLDEEMEDTLPALAESWQSEQEFLAVQVRENRTLFSDARRLFAALEVLEPDWPELLEQAECAESAEVSAFLLERIATYFAFRYLLKCVNDGDLLSNAKFVVFAVLVIERLAAVCGLSEALRRFSCEIEHSDANLDMLHTALEQGDIYTLDRFLTELSG